MSQKSLIRKKFLAKRKKKYFQIKEKFFNPLIRLLKKVENNIKYFDILSKFLEVDVLKILDLKFLIR